MSSHDLEPALRSISQLLRTEDDLDKVTILKEQLLTEKSLVEIELKSKSQAQIESVGKKLSQLNLCQDEIKRLRSSIGEVNKISINSSSSIERYELINKLTRAHEIFDQVTLIVERISGFNNELDEIDEMIENQDYKNIDIDHEVPDLLLIHYKLNNLLNFKDQVLEMSKFSPEDSKFIIKRLFLKIDPIVEKFNALLNNIIEGLVESVKIENNSLVIRLAKIIEFEELNDNEIREKKKLLLVGNEKALVEQIINGTIIGRIEERNYKQLFLDKIESSINETFTNCWDTFYSDSNEQLFEILNNLDWVFSDLKCVQDNLSKLIPPNWDIFKIYFDFYYKELNHIINKLIEKEPETYYILEILEFESKFKEIMQTEFNLKNVPTIIGDESKKKLLDDYLNLIIMKMNEWVINLQKTEQESFKLRLTAPDQDSEKLYGLKGAQIVFQMFTQQCDVASGSGQGKILEGVINKFAELLIIRQNNWSKLIQNEVSRLIVSNNKSQKKSKSNSSDDPENEVEEKVPAGLIEYLTALGNDQMRGADYTEAISNKYGSMVSKKYQISIHESLEKSIDGFADLAKQCCDGLIVIIFDDLKNSFNQIFSKSWYSNSINYSKLISDTVYEYLGEFNENMNRYLFEILLEEIIEEFVLRYLRNLKQTSLKIKDKEKFLALVKQDFENFFKLFIQFSDNEQIEDKFKILEDFLDLVTIEFKNKENSIIIEIWDSLLSNFNDIPLEFFKDSLALRKGIDSSDLKILINIATLKQNSFLQQNQYDLKQTFMGRY